MKKIDGNFIILGHSKGGNTSIYASMNQSRYFKDRIIKVYDLDGPGFKDNVYKLKKFKSIEEKVTRVVIKDDIVGCSLKTLSITVPVNTCCAHIDCTQANSSNVKIIFRFLFIFLYSILIQ